MRLLLHLILALGFVLAPALASAAPLPSPTALMFVGDSRMAGCGSVTRSGGAKIGQSTSAGAVGAFCGMLPGAINNVLLPSPTLGQYGMSASTTASLCFDSTGRLYDQGTRAANVATTGNNANAQTSVSADADENTTSLGVDPTTGATAAPLNDPATVPVYVMNINDMGVAFYGGAAGVEQWEARCLDLLLQAGKVPFVFNSVPQGFSTVIAERHAVAAGAVTATNSTNFLAWDNFGANSLGTFTNGGVYDAAGVVYTKVGSCGVTGQYTLAANVVTFCGTAPTVEVFLNYTWGTAPSTNLAEITAVHTWENSALRGGRPRIQIVDSYGAIADPADTTNHYALPGTMDALNKHPTLFAQQKAGDAFATAFTKAFPGLIGSQEQAPTANNWLVCNTNSSATTYSNGLCPTAGSFTLPSLNGTHCPGASSAAGGMWIMVNGVVRAKNDGAGGWVDQGQSPAVTGGAYNCSTGTWSITVASAFANNLKFEILQDPLSAVDNGLFDANQGTVALPTNVTAAAGSTGTPKGWTLQLDTCLTNSLAGTGMAAGETFTITNSNNIASSPITVTDEDGTWPAEQVTVSGIADGTGCVANSDSTITLTNSLFWANTFFPATPTTGERGSLRVKYTAGTNGHIYGTGGAYYQAIQNVTGTWTPAWGSAAVTAVTLESLKGSGLTPITDMSLYSGAAFTQKQVTPFVSNLGMAAASANWTNAAGFSKVIMTVAQKVPVSVTFTVWRARTRPATQ